MTPSFFTSSPYYLNIVYLFIPFFQFQELQMWPPQLEHPKVATIPNIMWHPKVAKANNDI
jgi:hypothetical protein